MNYQAIYNEVVNLRFNNSTTKLAQVKNWVGQAEIAVWNSADWWFKRLPVTTVTTTISSGVASGTLGAGASKVHKVWLSDSTGQELAYLRPDEFENNYSVGSIQTGTAEAFTVMEDPNTAAQRALYVGPAQAGTFKVATRRRYVHLNAGGAKVAGLMSADTDTPYWDSEYHYILVPVAIRLGKLLEDDPSAPLSAEALSTVFGEVGMWQAMVDELADGAVEDVLQVWSC